MIILPNLNIPRVTLINPSTPHAEQHGRKFVRHFGLVPNEARAERHNNCHIGTLAGHTYLQADRHRLELITAWIGCLFALDDLFDETTTGHSPKQVRKICDRVLAQLPPSVGSTPTPTGEFDEAFKELWRRTSALMSEAWRTRFHLHLANFFDYCVWEAENRAISALPPLDEYRSRRADAFLTYADFIEIANDAELPGEIATMKLLRTATLAAGDITLWTNDLFSWARERENGEVHNYVSLKQQIDDISAQEAVDAVGSAIRIRIVEFDELIRKLRTHFEKADFDKERGALERHLTSLGQWLPGQLAWRFVSERQKSAWGTMDEGPAQ
ncbi:hypothetical protein [Streptomyces cyaneofuscatus]|uniref:terpene synthase family protein n=1 Tax=Streptomyces cyaneofuscatus TaxID=66883 RepID=UPI00364FBFC7